MNVGSERALVWPASCSDRKLSIGYGDILFIALCLHQNLVSTWGLCWTQSKQYLFHTWQRFATSNKRNKDIHRILYNEYCTLVFLNKNRFDKTEISQIRKYFKVFAANNSDPSDIRFRWCLIIDEDILQLFIQYSKPRKPSVLSDGIEENSAWMTVVGSEYNLDSYPSQDKRRLYREYIQCHLNRLQVLA